MTTAMVTSITQALPSAPARTLVTVDACVGNYVAVVFRCCCMLGHSRISPILQRHVHAVIAYPTRSMRCQNPALYTLNTECYESSELKSGSGISVMCYCVCRLADTLLAARHFLGYINVDTCRVSFQSLGLVMLTSLRSSRRLLLR